MSRFSDIFPDLNIPEYKKDEDWHKRWVKSIFENAVDARYGLAYQMMQENYNFYDGIQASEEYNFLQTSESGDTLPAIWINYNQIRNKVDVLLGELTARGFGIRVRAQNKESESKRLDKKFEMLTQMRLKDIYEEMEDSYGIPVMPPGHERLPDDLEELEDYLTSTYKDECERVMENALRYLVKKYEWDYLRIRLCQDLIITARCFCKMSIEEGLPKYNRVDPRFMVFDVSAKDDFLRDSAYFGEIRYMPLSEAVQLYNLTKKEVETVKRASGISSQFNTFLFNLQGSYLNSTSNIAYLTGTADSLKVLVLEAEWQDWKTVKRKKSTDKFGITHYKKVKPNAKGKDIVSKKVKIWRKGTLIGGEIMRDYGVMENMVRSVDDIYDTKSSYVSLCQNWVNYQSVSKVQQLKGLQKFKNIALYNLQLQMNRAGGKGFMYDISMIPDGWNLEEVLYYLKTAGVGVYNSKQDGGIQSPSGAFAEFDMTISQSINQYLMISQMLDREMDVISGINEARQGVIQNASQAVGVTQAAIQSSNTNTATLFEAFRKFGSEMLNHLAGLVKITWPENKELYAPIIGDAGVDFLQEDVDLHLQDYAAFAEMEPPLIGDMNQLQGYIHAALQAQQIEITDALDLIREKNVDLAIRRLKRAIKKRGEEQAEQQQEAQQQQMQMQAMMAQQQQQADMAKMQAEQQAQAQRMAMQIDKTSQNRMNELAMKERLKASEELAK